ncbi:MAG: hypothetical protein L0Z55_02925 [Planctomycetes bacterium]|nr:hypothetical protein [Planctomycetota bacterium]
MLNCTGIRRMRGARHGAALARGCIVAALAAAGCGAPATVGEGAAARELVALAHAIEFDGVDGKKLFKLDPGATDVELEDREGNDVAEYRIRGDSLAMTSGATTTLFERANDGAILVRAEAASATRYKLVPEPDGDAILEDYSRNLRLELKKRDYGYKIVDGGGVERFKVRIRDGKTSIRDPNDQTILSSRDELPALAAACFALDGLPCEVQAGLALAVVHWKLGDDSK